jgi:choline dehydrogenase
MGRESVSRGVRTSVGVRREVATSSDGSICPCGCRGRSRGASQDGFGRYQCTQRHGMRCSTAGAYLRPAMSRANLKIFINAHATRLLFDRHRACGVEFARDGRLEQVQADTEVILAGGAYNSPQLLMLSGIGPVSELTRIGISVRGDLPVGVGLQDHPLAWLSWHTETESLITAATPENHALLQNEGRGPLSSNGAEAGGFVRTRAGLPAPDIQFHAVPVIVYDDYQDVIPVMEHGISLSPCVLKPLSRGKVALRNASPFSKPAIVHNYYAEPEDRQSMIEGIRAALEIAAQPSMRTHITGSYRAPKSDSEADIWEHVQRYTQTIYHPTSTCAIGPVVDNELRVHGFEGLRVVDASVMPSIVRGNTNAPTIMIAERAADLIREARGGRGA